MATKEEKKGGEVVRVQEKVTVYATDKAKHVRSGEEMIVHPELAKKLVEAGKATEKQPNKP